MKTTILLDDAVAARLRSEAERRGTTMSRLVEDALLRYLESRPSRRRLPALPAFDGGRHLVDVSDRESLYRAMEEGGG